MRSHQVFAGLSPEHYCALALSRICEKLLSHAAETASFLSYNDLTPTVVKALSERLGLAMGERDLAELDDVFDRNAKSGRGEPFLSDDEKKADAASPEVRASYQQYLSSIHARLEQRRLASSCS